MAAHIPEERCIVVNDKTYFFVVKNAAAGCHPGPVTPSTTDRAPFNAAIAQPKRVWETE